MRTRLFIVLFLCLIFNRVFSQRILSLEESINIALKQSYTYKSAEIQMQNTLKGFEATQLRMLSKVDLNLNPGYNQSLSSQFDPLSGLNRYFSTTQTNWGGNLSISQPLIFSNGTLSLYGSFSGQNQIDINDALNKINYWSSSIILRQPLFAINSQKINYEKAEMNFEKTQISYTKTQMDIVYNVTRAFYSLFQSAKQLEINEVDVNQREESYKTSVKKFKAGLMPEVGMLQFEVDLANAKNDMLQKKRQFDQQKNQFKVLIGLPLDENISLILHDEHEYKIISIDTAKAVKLALENNIDLRNWGYDKKIQEYSIDEIKQKNRIRADLMASYGLNKTKDVIDNSLFKDPANSKSISLNISIPVWDWGANNLDIEAAQAQLMNLEMDHENRIIQAKQEIMDLLNQIELAKFRIDIAKRGLEIGSKSYEISTERFKSGQITSYEINLEQQRYTNAKLNELNSIIDYKLALADLKRKTFYDFENDVPIKILNDIKK
jgi:outer membrane protein TolC